MWRPAVGAQMSGVILCVAPLEINTCAMMILCQVRTADTTTIWNSLCSYMIPVDAVPRVSAGRLVIGI